MAQFARLGARKRREASREAVRDEAVELSATDDGPPAVSYNSPCSGPISGLADIPGLLAPTARADAPAADGRPAGPPARGAAPTGTAPQQLASAAPRLRRVSDTTLMVAPVALGTSDFGRGVGAHAGAEVLSCYRARGGNFIDTADSYAAGRSEQIIGSWMRAERCRDEIVVSTKVGRGAEFRERGGAGIACAVDASLQRLQTDRIDLLSFHFDDTAVPLEESLGAVDALIRAGKVRYLAAADFSANRLLEARVLAANGLPRFRVLQTHYNLLNRAQYESSLALAARAQGLAVLPYVALANGFLAGGYRSRVPLAQGARGVRVAAHLNRRGARVLGVLDRIAGEFSVQPATIAVAWLQSKTSVCAPVVGVERAGQLDAVMAASEFRLSRTDMIELDRATAAN